MQPYIGITGFKSKNEVDALLSSVSLHTEVPGNPGRALATGVLVSEDSLDGRPVDFRNPDRYPHIDSVPTIWSPEAFGVVHYCSRKKFLDVDKLVSRCGLTKGMGVQLNLVWPDHDVVSALKALGLVVILQVNQHTLSEVGFDYKALADGLRHYDMDFDCLLFDLSRGTGKELDPVTIGALMDMARSEFTGKAVTIAGGLGPGSMGGVRTLLSFKFSPYAYARSLYTSCDAESKLMGEGDDLDLAKCVGYLGEAVTLFCGR